MEPLSQNVFIFKVSWDFFAPNFFTILGIMFPVFIYRN